jgi:CPA2 family monovalent cation:H+ antiporter-2
MGLAQIGEFSFIIAALGLTLNVTSKFLYPIAVAVSTITTLFTPYLIKSADGIVNRFDRVAPRSLVNALELYTNWVGRLGQRHSTLATKLVRRWSAQMALNAALIAAVFIAAAFLRQHPPAWLNQLGLGDEWLKSALWLLAVICSLPMFIATSRKLQALGLLIAETKVSEATAGERTTAIRALVAQTIAIAGTVILGLYVIVLSFTLLPTFKVFVVLLVLAGFISWLLRRSFIRVYSKAQIALQETLSQPPTPRHAPAPAALPSLLREADLETTTIAAGSSAVGKCIRELQLRIRTGASIVGIERNSGSIINPAPEEELQAGDQVLLLGTREQLEAGKLALLE